MRVLRDPRSPLRLMRMLCMVIALCSGLLGCQSKEQDHEKALEELNERARALNEKLDVLYDMYLVGDRDQAKHSLEEMVSVIESAQVSPRHQAHSLWLTYSRLYVLETRGGNDPLADAYLLKARYWLLRKAELAGASPEEAAGGLKAFGADRLTEMIDHWDRRHTDGKGPNYAQRIGSG